MQSQEISFQSRHHSQKGSGLASRNRVNPKITILPGNGSGQRERSNLIAVPRNWLSLIDIKPINYFDDSRSSILAPVSFKQIFNESFHNYQSHPKFEDYQIIDPAADPTVIYSELLTRLNLLAKEKGFEYSMFKFSEDSPLNYDNQAHCFGVLLDDNYYDRDTFLAFELAALEGMEHGDSELYNVICFFFGNMISEKDIMTWENLGVSEVAEEIEMNAEEWSYSTVKEMKECLEYYKKGAPSQILKHLKKKKTIEAHRLMEEFSTSDKAINNFLNAGKGFLKNPLSFRDFNPRYPDYEDGEGVDLFQYKFLSWNLITPIENFYQERIDSIVQGVGVKCPHRIIEIKNSGWDEDMQIGMDFFDHYDKMYQSYYEL